MLKNLGGKRVEEPPEEACDTEISELDPLVCKLSRVDAEIAKYESRDNHGGNETYIEGIN